MQWNNTDINAMRTLTHTRSDDHTSPRNESPYPELDVRNECIVAKGLSDHASFIIAELVVLWERINRVPRAPYSRRFLALDRRTPNFSSRCEKLLSRICDTNCSE